MRYEDGCKQIFKVAYYPNFMWIMMPVFSQEQGAQVKDKLALDGVAGVSRIRELRRND